MIKIVNYLLSKDRSGAMQSRTNFFRPGTLVITYLLLLVCYLPQASAQYGHDDPAWVTTWTTSPSTLPASGPATDILSNQTVRLITQASVSGSYLRIRLSNVHGDQPLHIGKISIALQAEGAAIVEGSNRTIRFSGQEDIIIPIGATVISDSINFYVPQVGNLALSLYLPQDSGFITTHALANQTSYISSNGDQTDSTRLSVKEETSGWPFLTAIDVLPSEQTSAIVALGDSITDGWGSTDSANQRWPNQFAYRLYQDDNIKDFAVINAGISGNRVTTEASARFGQNLQARFERDVLALSNVSHIVLLEGINDIGMSPDRESPISAEEIIAGYRQIITRAHAGGIKIIGATLLPYEGAGYYSEAGNRVRMAVNNFIRESGEFDGVIEFDKAVQDPANPNRIRADFTEDNLHPNDIGYAAMAAIIDLDLFK